MPVSTGSPTLDAMLDGGYPEQRATLLTGTPGTGKSTLAMQFLQDGLENGETCLFISTEQTVDELRDAFAPFAFTLDHDQLTITSLHARTGQTFESDEPTLVLETFDDREVIGDGISAAFTSDRIQQGLERYAPCDRVVLDSVSGLQPMAQNRDVYRRGVLDLIQLFTDNFGATTVLTAEYVGPSPREQTVEAIGGDNTVQYNVYGVIRLWREQKRGELRRFIDVMKMRGVNHDTRKYEITFAEQGVDIIPRQRALPHGMADRDRLSTGVPELNTLLDGGFFRGESVLLEHDSRANLEAFFFAVLNQALAENMGIVVVPRVDTPPEAIDTLLGREPIRRDTLELLQTDQLFVLDALGAWKDRHNVFNLQREDDGIRDLLETIRDRATTDGLLLLLNTEAKVHTLGEEESRRTRYWLQSQMLEASDLLVDIHNPNLMAADLAEFYTDAATQVLETWLDDTGLQYVQLKKAPSGEIGGLRLVEYIQDDPYIRVK
ncbi:ATPase domain-containing protein [Haloarcula sp. JP-L23]|uniref:RAD55 family ATPase n=1 Tax=Haloarcula sp. JP-L23 TaxID=2716717 RepID=UPI00140EF8D6|nr:AAA family ATPase [Haloarcula sp. JP-L23]